MPGFVQRDQTFGLGRPGGVFRFAVGQLGEQSAVWKISASRTVVVMARGIDKDAKITFHQTGNSWLAAHRVSRGQELTGKPSRELVGWALPVPNAAGWVHALNVWVPHGELNNIYTEGEAQGQITWLRPAEPGHRVGVHLVLITPTSQRGGGLGEYLAGFQLGDGRALLVARTHPTYPKDLRDHIDAKRSESCVADQPGGPVMRCLVGQYEDGSPLHLWDLTPPIR